MEARRKSSSVSIGSGTFINNNFCAIAEHSSITIGKNCLIGFNVEITDSSFHGIEVVDRQVSRPEWAAPVVIGDNVFIGSNVKVLKGVKVGDGSVVANGAVVTKEIPPNCVFGGNPAKLIKMLER
ncbi:acyltransferase [Alcanivorax sp. IO_7]|nr:acyltransferase [Alcanivorax sp. IO_7]